MAAWLNKTVLTAIFCKEPAFMSAASATLLALKIFEDQSSWLSRSW